MNTELDELADALGALSHAELDGIAVAEACSGRERVLDVGFEAVVPIHHRGDAPLRVSSGGLVPGELGEDEDLLPRGRELQGEGEPGDPSTHHQRVMAFGHALSV